ncbi:MAG: alpha/beta fold hydrolase [Actinomycetia bacterium]|nr:alpha/beta fold hydrolase [Actinomycetes bacterium]
MATSEEVRLLFDWGGLSLAGSLHVPAGAGLRPAVVMAQGSGPADRESDGYFGPIRQTFLDRGIATFAFDKPGCGASSGDWRHYGLFGRADQIVAALDLVRNHPAVDGDRVGIWGHSQGGWLVQMLAGRPLPLAFAIASSGPTIGVGEQIRYDCEHTLRDRGHDDDEIRQALVLARELHRAAADGVAFEAISSQLLEPASRHSWYRSYPTIDNDADWQHARLLTGEPFEPVSALGGVECPFLSVYGGLDRLLPPWRGAQEAGHALANAASPDTTVVVFPRGDHRIQDARTSDFVDGYLDLLGDWTARRAR